MNYAYLCFLKLQRSLATDLQNLSMELRKKQSTYLKRLRLQKEVCEEFSLRSIFKPVAVYSFNYISYKFICCCDFAYADHLILYVESVLYTSAFMGSWCTVFSLWKWYTKDIRLLCAAWFLLIGYDINYSPLLLLYVMQGQDGVDLEMNLNGSRSKMEDDDLDDMVCGCFTVSNMKNFVRFDERLITLLTFYCDTNFLCCIRILWLNCVL